MAQQNKPHISDSHILYSGMPDEFPTALLLIRLPAGTTSWGVTADDVSHMGDLDGAA